MRPRYTSPQVLNHVSGWCGAMALAWAFFPGLLHID